jgi:chromosome partitioning protein
MYDVLVHHIDIRQVIRKREVDIACASIDLAGAEIAMSTQIGRERSLQKAFKRHRARVRLHLHRHAAEPRAAHDQRPDGGQQGDRPRAVRVSVHARLIQLQNTLEMIKENLNPDVDIEGILPTLVDSRTLHAKEAIEILEENFGIGSSRRASSKTIRFARRP